MELLKTPLERLIQERQLLTDLENEENSFKIQEWNSTDTNELHLNFSLKIGTIDFNGVLVYPELSQSYQHIYAHKTLVKDGVSCTSTVAQECCV